jgi:copper chaperone NosL
MKKIILLFLVCGITACKRQFEPINFGHEACTHCKMTIMDKRFAAEILTGKGRAIKFDDLGCLLKYLKDEHFADPEAKLFVADYSHPGGEFLNARTAIYIHSDQFQSPMGGNYASSATNASAGQLNASFKTTLLKWDNLK